MTLPVAVTPPGRGEHLTLPFGDAVVLLDGAATGGALSVMRMRLPAGTVGAAPHVHHGHQEYFEIRDGEVTFDLDDGVTTLGPGGVACVPAGRAHGFRNEGEHDAVILGMFTPAGYEDYFREVARLFGEGVAVTADLLATLRARHRTEPAPHLGAG